MNDKENRKISGLRERDPRSHAVIGAAMEVHNQMGRGFLEAVYCEALAVEMDSRGIPFAREVELRVHYKGRELPCYFKADFVCFDHLIVEIKAITETGDREFSQVINYLKTTGESNGILINFGAKSLEFKRFVESKQLKSLSPPDLIFPSV